MAMASLSFLVRFAAIDKGPVSLVAAIGSLQPLLVFFYAYGLATVFPANFSDWITKRTISTQVAGTVAISAGVVVIVFSRAAVAKRSGFFWRTCVLTKMLFC